MTTISLSPNDTPPRTRRGRRENNGDDRKNITVDADLVGLLNEKANELEVEFGFRPTLSQTLRHLLHRFGLK